MLDPDTSVIILLFVMLLVACIAGIALKAKLKASELRVVHLLKTIEQLETLQESGKRISERRARTLGSINDLLRGL